MRRLSRINLNALLVAESAARHANFTRAAEESYITPSAVSQQIKKLEDQLEFKLFYRERNTVSLTPEGEAFIEAVREAIDRIITSRNEIAAVREALDQIVRSHGHVSGRDESAVLKVSLLPTFAIRWLLPRLCDFQSRYPELQIHVSQSYKAVDFDRDDVDIAVRYGSGSFTGLYEHLLFKEDLIPVCSPRLLAETLNGEDPADLTPRDLGRFTLLHSDTCTVNWRTWLERAGATEVLDQSPCMYFDSCLMSFQAANAGLGFAVANRAYVADDIEAGRLVAPFDLVLPNQNGWYLVCPEAHRGLPRVRAFETWLVDQANKARGAYRRDLRVSAHDA